MTRWRLTIEVDHEDAHDLPPRKLIATVGGLLRAEGYDSEECLTVERQRMVWETLLPDEDE